MGDARDGPRVEAFVEELEGRWYPGVKYLVGRDVVGLRTFPHLACPTREEAVVKAAELAVALGGDPRLALL